MSLAVLAGYAKKASYETRRVVRIAGRYSLEREARRLLGDLGLEARKFRITYEKGWARFECAKLNGMSKALLRVRELAEQWAADRSRWENQRGLPYDLQQTEDLLANPELLDIALHEDLLRAATEYLGQVPRLQKIAVWWSPPNETLRGSQMFHYDPQCSLEPKVFINLNDVTAASGPLHFFDADRSAQFNAEVGYARGRIPDEKVFSVCSPADLHSTIGPAGAGVIVDTARCLHYGSRGNKEGRLVFMITYVRVNCIDPGDGDPTLDPVRQEIARVRYPNDPVRNFVLTAPHGSNFILDRLGRIVRKQLRSTLRGRINTVGALKSYKRAKDSERLRDAVRRRMGNKALKERGAQSKSPAKRPSSTTIHE
jgi:hypothetical protein